MIDWRTRAAGAAAIWLAFAPLASAQATSAAPSAPAATDPEKLRLAREVFEAVGGADSMRESLQAAVGAVSKEQVPLGNPAVQKHAAEIQAYAAQQVVDAVPQIMAAAEQVYAQDFSTDQLKDILAFYQSPTGQALKAKLPDIARQMILQLRPTMMELRKRIVVHALTELCAENACTADQRSALAKLTAPPS